MGLGREAPLPNGALVPQIKSSHVHWLCKAVSNQIIQSCDRRPVGSPCRRGPATSKARLGYREPDGRYQWFATLKVTGHWKVPTGALRTIISWRLRNHFYHTKYIPILLFVHNRTWGLICRPIPMDVHLRKSYQLLGGEAPQNPWPGALPPDPRYRLALRALAMGLSPPK